ncbi:MAG: methyl-accepting chemotaxis protein [Pseudomonadota bacterium]
MTHTQNDMQSAFIALREKTARYLSIWLWVHIPLLAAFGYFTDRFMPALLVFSAVFSAVASWLTYKAPSAQITRNVIAAVFMLQVSALVFQMPPVWRIDAHMYYFAALAMLCVFTDWKAILVGTVVVALHHVSLNFLYPLAIFPESADFARVVLHAVILVCEAAALTWITQRMEGQIVNAQSLLVAMNKSAQEKEAADARAKSLQEKEAQRKEEDAQTAARAADERAALELKSQKEASEARAQERSELAKAFEDEISGIVTEVLGQMENASTLTRQVGTAVGTVSDKFSTISVNTGQTSETVGDLSSATQQLSQSCQDAVLKINQSSGIISNAMQAAEDTNTTISALDEAAARISEIVDTIQSIADQTNLLALNATIEAARAGEAGKGFAVVASEVKALAQQTAKATDEVSSHIQAVQDHVGKSVEEIGGIRDTFASVTEISQGLEQAMAEQQDATQSIARSVERASGATQGVAHEVEGTADLVGDCSRSSEEMETSIGHVMDQIVELRSRMDSFVGQIKAA